MNRIPEMPRIPLALVLLIAPALACALPEDDTQQILFEDFAASELSLDDGVYIQKAHPDRPTCVRQGTRVICGAEIRLERAEDGTVRKVTATGTPASYEQKPAADQEVARFTGLRLVFDNDARLLTVDGDDAKFSQGTNSLEHRHIEYHLDTHDLVTNGGDSDSSGQMIVLPAPKDGN